MKEYSHGVVTFDDIGRAAFTYYKADIERFNAKNQRAIARSKNPCTNETFDYVNGEPENFRFQPCWTDEHLGINEWCEGCKAVQPYHIVYIESAKKARVAKARLSRFCKVRLWNDGN